MEFKLFNLRLSRDVPSGLSSSLPFSPLFTLFCLTVCVAGVSLMVWSTSLSWTPPLGPSSSRDLERLADRLLAFETQLSRLTPFEQFMYRLGGGEFETQEDIMRWYQELLSEQNQERDKLYAGVLWGESRSFQALDQLLEKNSNLQLSSETHRKILRIVYLNQESDEADFVHLQATLAEDLPGNWFYFRLASRLAERAGDLQLKASLDRQSERLNGSTVWKWRTALVMELLVVALGLIGLLVLHHHQKSGFSPPGLHWTFGEGVAVLARGGALTVFLIGLVAVLPLSPDLIIKFGFLLIYLPVLMVAYGYLFYSRHRSVFEVFGLSHFSERIRSTFPIVLIVLALGLLGDWAIMFVGASLGYSVHWTEWFIPELVWGTSWDLFLVGVQIVIVAPFFEEMIFRGLIFSTLNARFGIFPSMIGSSLIFALVHGYGLLAFLTVFWSGILWAWTYHKTGSLLPGIIAHACNNGFVIYTLLTFFR